MRYQIINSCSGTAGTFGIQFVRKTSGWLIGKMRLKVLMAFLKRR